MSGVSKAWTFLTTLSILCIGLGHWLGDRQGLLFGVGLALGINSLIYFYDELRAQKIFSAHKLEGQDPWGLQELATKLSHQLKIPVPTLFIIESDCPQAMSMGRSLRSSKIFLTRGLLERFDEKDIAAVLAFEMATIQRLDTFAFMVACALSDFLFSAAQLFDTFIGWIVGAKSAQRRSFFASLVAPFAAFFVHAIVGSSNYFRVDELTTQTGTDSKNLAKALWKLDSYAATKPLEVPAALAHLFIVNPLTKPGLGRYFQVQPGVQRRIKRLVGYYPI